MKTKLLWKTIPESFENHGHKWAMKKWFKVDGKLDLCSRGFHASEKTLDAFGYIAPGWVCRVKVRGESVIGDDKSCWSEMMILERTKWTKKMSVELAIYAAELVLPIFEKEYPNDNRPANAIAAAKAYLKKPSAATRAAASAAASDASAAASDASAAASAAAWAASAAASDASAAASAASDAASAAAWAASDAASAAAWAASAAASAAAWAASAAARAAILVKIENKIKKIMRAK